MISSRDESIGLSSSQFGRPIRRALLRLTVVVEEWVERRRQRRALRELSEHVLKDIGIGRGEAEQEWRKPFWRA
jgi:uncharacterized protein YjiS (DUF1127 family)